MASEDLHIRDLLHAFAENRLNEEQAAELFQYLQENKEPADQLLLEFTEKFKDRIFESVPLQEEISLRMKQSLLEKINAEPAIQQKNRSIVFRMRWAAVAAIFLLVATTIYYLNEPDQAPASVAPIVNLQHTATDALPGYDGAILTTANGKRIILDSATNGIVSKEENTPVVKQGNQLIYNEPSVNPVSIISYNTLSTLKGRKFQLVLADGTKVWLDAASSITYPIAFTGNQRRVKASGQLYFEVAKDASKPFIVEAGGTSVLVLGTHFNINAYEDEATTRTTLLEGSVKVSGNDESLTIKPGQQAVVGGSGNGKISVNGAVDIEAVMAWRRGLFQFSNADITVVLRQLARWYDMEIVYEGKIPVRKFEGKIGRDLNLSQVLRLLEKLQVRFRIEGHKLIVQP